MIVKFNSISRENNINAIRYYLAICILMGHFCTLTGIDVVRLPRIFGGAGSFFTISGFLMFPSFAKNSDVKRYLKRRANRIFPPYFLIVIAAALLCVFITSLSPAEYFTSPGFWKYLGTNLTFLNFLSPDLPDVFSDVTNRVQAVNGSLWTMKGEVACYLTIPVIFWLTRKRVTAIHRLLCWLMLAFIVGYLTFKYLQLNGGAKYDIAARQCLVMFLFYLGGFINLHLDFLRRHSRVIISVCGSLLIFHYINKYCRVVEFPTVINGIYNLIVVPLASGLMVIACSVTGSWGKFLAHHNALTYEIYLFHFPVIQILIYFGCVENYGFYPSLILAILITSLLALLSWRLIGQRFMKSG